MGETLGTSDHQRGVPSMINHDTGAKTLTIEQLIQTLHRIDGQQHSQWRLIPNLVGNLLILNAAGEKIGYIDFLFDGDVVWFVDQDEEK